MKTLALLPVLALAALPARGDSVVVFNELQYHPPGAETANGEWLEVRNQTAVDIDISGWSLADGVTFNFPEGTIIPARAYLVVAATPAGIPGALGPWTGRLDNAGENVALHNNSGRVMDELDYETEGKWPVAPDGVGFTLARRLPVPSTSIRTHSLRSLWVRRAIGSLPAAIRERPGSGS